MPSFRTKYGHGVIPTGFFLLREDGRPQRGGSYTDGDGPLFTHLSTFPERSTIKEHVLEAIRSATHHVFFANFLIQDDEVVQSLISVARRLNGHVYVLTTLKTDDFAAATGRSDGDEGDFQAHIQCIERLSAAGILVKARSDCHAKFLTIDDRTAIITSANAVATCYGNVKRAHGAIRDANPENGVIITITAEVRRLSNLFRAIWRDGCNYFVKPGSTVFSVEDITSATLPIRISEPAQPDENGEVLWTAPEDRRLARRIVEMINSAKEQLDLSTWVVKGMDNHPIGKALETAADRGVRVRLLVRGMNTRDDLRDQCYRLAKNCGDRLSICGDYWNHSKAIVVDNREAMILTANLDAQHGLNSGIEVGFWAAQPAFVSAVTRFLGRLFDEAAFSFVADPSQATMANRYGRQKPPRLQGVLRLIVDDRPWENKDHQVNRWCQDLTRQLVRVAQHRHKGREHVLLLTERTAAYCTPQADGSYAVLRLEDEPSDDIRGKFCSYLGQSEISVEWT